MFSRKDQLLRKTGPDGIGRFDFLRLLKKEFEETVQEDSKNQTLANLANFAYDPINYEYMRSLNLIDLFLEQFKSGNEELIHFSSAAICNLSADPTNRDIIVRKNGIKLVVKLLYSKDEEVVLNSITTLMFLRTEETDFEIHSSPEIINKMQELKTYGGSRLRNLATLYLES